MSDGSRGRRAAAFVLGASVALAVMATAWRAIRWPAPGIGITLGVGTYFLVLRLRA